MMDIGSRSRTARNATPFITTARLVPRHGEWPPPRDHTMLLVFTCHQLDSRRSVCVPNMSCLALVSINSANKVIGNSNFAPGRRARTSVNTLIAVSHPCCSEIYMMRHIGPTVGKRDVIHIIRKIHNISQRRQRTERQHAPKIR